MESRNTWILDPGHGEFKPGKGFKDLREWEFNRDIAQRVVAICHGIDVRITNPGPVDAGLIGRWKYARGLHKQRKNCAFISIHANAAGKGKDWVKGAHGVVVFHYPKDKKGNELARWMLDSFGMHTDISIDRGIKTARFSVLAGTQMMPSILVECGFMTNPHDYDVMMSQLGRERIARAIARTIQNMELKGGL